MEIRSVLEKFDSTKIAKLLFVINLPLSILSGFIIFVFIMQVAMSNPTVLNSQIILFGILLIVGIIAEIAYYLQGRFTKYAGNKMFWCYSIAVQGIFISAYFYDLFLAEPSGGVIGFIAYPIVFLVLSIIGLMNAAQLRS